MKQKAPVLSAVNGSRGWFPLIIGEARPGDWQKNIEWTVDCVLAHHAVYSCITLISNDIGKLRHKLVQEDDGIWNEVTNPAYSPVLRKPNRYQNQIQFRQWWITSKLIRGNTYALKVRDNRKVVVGLYILDPCRVQPMVTDSGDIFYQLQGDNLNGLDKGGLMVPASEIIHDRMNCLFHPLVGISPLFAAGCVANLGLKIEHNSSRFFGNASQPSGILTAPGAISDANSKILSDYFNENFTGEKSGRVAVLGDGLKYERLSVTASESQMIEQLRWTAEVICSTFHVPPYKIGVGDMPTYNNVEALQQDYYNTCLQSLIEEYEACLDEGLGIAEDMGVELDLDALLRMDSKTQIEVLNASVSGSLRTINEAREKLNLGKVDGGDSIWMQQQDTSLAALAKRDEQGIVMPATPLQTAPTPTVEDDEEQIEMAAFLGAFSKGLSELRYV